MPNVKLYRLANNVKDSLKGVRSLQVARVKKPPINNVHPSSKLTQRELTPPLWVAIKKMPLIGNAVEGILETLTQPPEVAIYERHMVPLEGGVQENFDFEFTTMTYNVLAECYVIPSRYSHCPEFARRWSYRSKQILTEISTYKPDILFLQEVDHYKDFFEPALAKQGYTGIFMKRSGLRLDGCAVFYKSNKFDLVTKTVIEYNDLLKSNKFDNATKAYLRKDNVGIIATLQPKKEENKSTSSSSSSSSPSMRRVIVATTHLYWDPKFAWVKTAQAQMLLEKVSQVNSATGSEDAAVIIGGDFNSVPDSDVYASFSEAKMDLYSAYSSFGEPETHFTTHYFGCLDYIWHTPNRAVLKEVLQPVPSSVCENKCEFPSPRFPSDHLPLLAHYALL